MKKENQFWHGEWGIWGNSEMFKNLNTNLIAWDKNERLGGMQLSKDVRMLWWAVFLGVMTLLWWSNLVRAQEAADPCGEIKATSAECLDLVYRIDISEWELDIDDLEKTLYEIEANNMNVETVLAIIYDVDYAQSHNFVSTMVPVFRDIYRYSESTISWRDLLPFIKLHQFLVDGENDMAHDMAEEIITVFSSVSDMRFILEKHWFAPREA